MRSAVIIFVVFLSLLCHQPAISASMHPIRPVDTPYAVPAKSAKHEPRTRLGRLFARLDADARAHNPKPLEEGVFWNPYATTAAVALGVGLIAVAAAAVLNLSWILLIACAASIVATVFGGIGLGRKRKNRWLATLSLSLGIVIFVGSMIVFLLDTGGSL